MPQLSPAGQQAISDVAQRHGFSFDAVLGMLDAVMNGNGSMAQFSHPEFGGSGQWMRGGMIMIGDMFNNQLKGRIDSLCFELASLVASQPGLVHTGSFQSQSQGGQFQGGQFQGAYGGGQQQQGDYGPSGPVSLFVPAPGGGAGNWWPGDLGSPSSVGSQNNVRYAYFPQSRRLAVDAGGRVTVYDTQDHQIGGFSQQQSSGGSLTFSSQYGLVDLARLPVVSGESQAPPQFAQPAASPPQFAQPAAPPPQFAQPAAPPPPAGPGPAGANAGEGEIVGLIEKLADLRAKGVLTEDEFAAKKAELLSRL